MKRLILTTLLFCFSVQAETTKVAVIDTGMDFDSTWSKYKGVENIMIERPKLCATGHYDFVEFNDRPKDKHGHGTHIAGVIAKENASVDYCLVILKYWDEKADGKDNLVREILAIEKAIEEKVNVINISGGGIIRSELECTTIKKALDAGIEVFVAAGNEKADLSRYPYYPAMCDDRIHKILAVKTMNKNKQGKHDLIEMSNYDSTGKIPNVMEMPGKNIMSTLPDDKVGYMSGTSQATAFATGAYIRYYESNIKSKELLIKSRYFDKYRTKKNEARP